MYKHDTTLVCMTQALCHHLDEVHTLLFPAANAYRGCLHMQANLCCTMISKKIVPADYLAQIQRNL